MENDYLEVVNSLLRIKTEAELSNILSEKNLNELNLINQEVAQFKIELGKNKNIPKNKKISINLRISRLIKLIKKFIDNINDLESFEKNIDKTNHILFNNKSSLKRLQLPIYTSNKTKMFPQFINNDFSIESQKKTNIEQIRKWIPSEEKYIEINPFPHQKFVSDYLNENTPYKGLLLYHGLGSGKTGASILIAEGYRKKQVAVLLPASLKKNFINEIISFGETAYKKNFNWNFFKINNNKKNTLMNEKYKNLLNKLGIDEELHDKIISKRNNINTKVFETGIWVIDYSPSSHPNYDKLNVEDQKSISKQINILLNHKYTFCHYNAGSYTITSIISKMVKNYETIYQELFSDKKVSQLNNKDKDRLLNYIYINNLNPFDDKVIIIDEIHNFTSGITGSGYNNQRLYELILRAKNTNLIFLSGTPVINFPYELGLMYNLLKGLMISFKIPLIRQNGIFDPDELNKILTNFPLIERFEINTNTKEILVVRTPRGFIKKLNQSNQYIGLIKDKINDITENQFLIYLSDYLIKNNYQQTKQQYQKEEYTIFNNILRNTNDSGIRIESNLIEQSENAFNNLYVNQEEIKIKNEIDFKNRIIGLTSFYNEVSSKDETESIFPTKIFASDEKTNVQMSDYQFIKYCENRSIERNLEEIIKKQSRIDTGNSDINVNTKIPNLFKVYTRQSGIFVFPPEIKRPRPNQFRVSNLKKKELLKEDQVSFDAFKKLIIDTTLKQKQQIETIIEISKENSDPLNYISKSLNEIITELMTNTFVPLFIKYGFFSKDIFLLLINAMYSKNFNDINQLVRTNFEFMTNESISEENVHDLIENYQQFTRTHDIDLTSTYQSKCTEAINQLDINNLSSNSSEFNLNLLSPKYLKILNNIKDTPGPVFIYSQYRQIEGIEIFTKVLNFNGYIKLDFKNPILNDSIELEVGNYIRYTRKNNQQKFISSTHKILEINGTKYTCSDIDTPLNRKDITPCRYALWTGSESVDEREKALEMFNSIDNMYGNQCLILLITKSGAEGISLKFVRQVHIMEPYWNNVRINQVIGRARRINSHKELPKEEQNVEIFNYIIKFTDKQLSGDWLTDISKSILDNIKESLKLQLEEEEDDDKEMDDEIEDLSKSKDNLIDAKLQGLSDAIRTLDNSETSDQVLKNISDTKENILNQFQHLLKETAIDCEFNKEDNIRSDTNLSSINCYNYIQSSPENFILNFANVRTFDITENISRTKVTELNVFFVSATITTDSKTGDDYQIKIVVTLSPEYNDWNEAPDKTPIYDYYVYHKLNPEYDFPLKHLKSIGFLNKNSSGNISFTFNDEFISNIPLYITIENKELLDKNTNDGNALTKELSKLLPESDKESIDKIKEESIDTGCTETQWYCIVCEECVQKGEMCPNCFIEESMIED